MVELTGALSNPPVKDELLPNLSQLREKLLSGKHQRRSSPRGPIKPRVGLISETIKHVLAVAGKPLTVKEVHDRCQELLGRPVSHSTVKGCLNERDRVHPLFDRVDYGVYQLHIDLEPYGRLARRRRYP